MPNPPVGLFSFACAFLGADPKPRTATARGSTQDSDPLRQAFVELAERVMARSPSDTAGVGAAELGAALRARVNGLELDLRGPGVGLRTFLRALQPHEMEELLLCGKTSGGNAIAYLELDADSFEAVRTQIMHGCPDLAFAVVHVPEDAPAPHVEGLANVRIERDEPAGATPCKDDPELHRDLVHLICQSAPLCKPGNPAPHEIARAIMNCARIEDSGDFGWDFRKLASHQVSWLQDLPPEAMTALQDSAERAGTGTAWVDLPDGMPVTAETIEQMKRLSPMLRLSLSAKGACGFIGLGGLQGSEVGLSLKEVTVRDASEALEIEIPSGVKLNLPEDGGDDRMSQWVIVYIDDSGKAEETRNWIEELATRQIMKDLHGALSTLIGTLTGLLESTDRSLADAQAIAHAIADCARFDSDGSFGWSFRKLDAEQVKALGSLPDEGFTALQRSADLFDGAHWVDKPESVSKDLLLEARLRELQLQEA